MNFVFPGLLLAGAAALIIIIVCLYLLAYRAHANRALKSGAAKPMAAPRTVLAVSAVAVLLCAAALGYAAGYKALTTTLRVRPPRRLKSRP